MYILPGEQRIPDDDYLVRTGLVLLLAGIFSLFIYWVYVLQIADGEKYFAMSIDNAYNEKVILSKRADILTADGVVIGFSDEVYVLDTLKVEQSEVEGIAKACKPFDMSSSKDLIFDEESYQNCITETNVDPLSFTRKYIRRYSFGDVFAPITGYVSQPNQADLDRGVSRENVVGRDGLERYYEDLLNGEDGVGLEINRFDGSREFVVLQNPIDGQDLYTNVYSKWQINLYNILKNVVDTNKSLSGSALIIESESGKVRAMVNYPSFDPNSFSNGISEQEYSKLSTNPALPLLNKILGIRLAPGSTFKPVVSEIGFQNGLINEYEEYYSAGCEYIDKNIQFCEADKKVLGNVNFFNAISRSSNLYFCNLAKKFKDIDGSSLTGAEYLFEGLDRYEIDKLTGIDLYGEIAGVLPSPEVIQSRENRLWGIGDMCNTFIGQGDLLVTPLRMGTIVGSFVNGGRIMKPNILDYSKGENGEIKYINVASEIGKIGSSPDILDKINRAMTSTLEDDMGTGRALQSIGVDIKLKTGSADATEKLIDGTVRKGAHSWVVGTFKYEDIDYSFVVVQQFGGRGYQSIPIVGGFVNCLKNDFVEGCEKY